MFVGTCKISLSIHEATSLKMKRKIVKSLKDKVRSRFNVSISEIANHDIYQSSILGVCVVSSEQSHADRQLQAVFNFISQNATVDNVSMEYMRL